MLISNQIKLSTYLVVSIIITIFVLTMRDRVGFGGRQPSQRVDSNLLYKIYKGPHLLLKKRFVLYKSYCYLYSTMKTLLILFFLPLFSVGISMMITRPLPCEPLVEPLREEGRYV